MSPISASIVKHHQRPTVFHYLSRLCGWALILGQPKILRMEVQVVSQDSPKLLDRLRAEIRARHYSIRTEETYVDWARRFILYHNKKHPKDMGAEQVRDFLSHLAVQYSHAMQNLCRFNYLPLGAKAS